MPRGYQCVFLATVGIALIGAAPQNQRGAQSDQQNTTRSTEQSLANIAMAIQEANKAPKPDPGCKPGQDDRSSDLCAQWKAADAAAESATWTFATFILAIFGTVIGAFTLIAAGFAAWYARHAAIETRRSADTADIGNAISADTAKRQLRAYLGVAASIVPVRNDERSLSGVRGVTSHDIRIEIKNFGQTPASLLYTRIEHFKGSVPYAPEEEPSRGQYPDRPPMLLAPGAVSETFWRCGLSKAQLNGVKEGTAAIYLTIHLIYTDIYGDEHEYRVLRLSTGRLYQQRLFGRLKEEAIDRPRQQPA